MPVLIAPIIAFISALVSRIGIWFVTLSITGALRVAAIYIASFALYAAAITGFLLWVNDLLVGIVNGLSPLTQGVLSTFIAWIPSNLPYYVSLILSYYATSATFYIALEIKKYRQRAAEEATKVFHA